MSRDPLRMLPQDLDAEAAVLSALMLVPESISDVREKLSQQDFYSTANKRVFETLLALDDANEAIDATTVASLLKRQGKLEGIGGTAYLAQLTDATPAVSHVESHALIVRDKARVRRAITICERFAAEGYGDVGDIGNWIQSLERAVYELTEQVDTRESVETFAEAIPKSLAEIQEQRDGKLAPAVSTGYADLDKKLAGGMRRGKEYIIGGRPGMGKSASAQNIALNVARQDLAAVYISCEMNRHELVCRSIAVEKNISATELLSADMTVETWASAQIASEAIRKLPFALRYCPGATIGTVRSTTRKAMRQLRAQGFTGELGIIVVDYLQIMSGDVGQNGNREGEISGLSRGLLLIAGEFDVPVLAVSQLNRVVEKRDAKSKRPRLEDLRESGAIEQDAYGVMLLYRDEYYYPDTMDKGVLEVNLAKHRNGPTGTVKLHFTGDSTRVSNLATHNYDHLVDHDTFQDGMDGYVY